MNILSIEIQNNKHVRCFKRTLNGDNLMVAGDTGTGKTTAISALWDIMKKCPDALTHGEKKGAIRVKLSDGTKTITAVRETTAKTSSIKITDGIDNNISITDFKKMLSDLSVDPHKIASMKPNEQLRTLAAVAGIEGLDEMNAGIKTSEENRLDLFRQVGLLSPGEEPEKVEAVDVSALVAEKENAGEHNYACESKQRDLDSMIEHGKRLVGEIKNLEDLFKAKTAEKDKLLAEALTLKAEVGAMEIIDTSDLTQRIANAQETNDAAATHRNWVEANERHEVKSEEHTEAVALVKELRDVKRDALDNAQWPIAGLTIDDGAILYNGCLLSNLGESQQLLVCAAIAVKEIAASPIKVVRMDGVESMSPDDLGALQKLFNGKGVQVLSARVTWGETLPDEIVIVDGEYSE